MMSLSRDTLDLLKCRGRFQLFFLRALVITLLVWLLFYTVTVTDVKVHTDVTHTWNISRFLQSAVFKFQSVLRHSKEQRETKTVLLWTDFFSSGPNWLPSTQELQCPVTECTATSNRTMLGNSSAILLHWRDINSSDLPQCTPSDTVQCPPWILFNQESPPHTNRELLEALQGRVHWTVNYRRESDIFAPYGRIGIRERLNFSKPAFNPNKRLVCWLVSNCETPSNREEFVHELKNYISVDQYGRCGGMRCPLDKAKDCYRWLSNKCLFYLSLENSICKDYTTEKLYYALANNMVPVVMGNTSNYDHLPPHSYINAYDFSSPKELAEYLVTVGKDRELYESYLSWHSKFEVIDNSYRWFCDLCEKLHETDLQDLKPREGLVQWWFDQSQCISWQNL